MNCMHKWLLEVSETHPTCTDLVHGTGMGIIENALKKTGSFSEFTERYMAVMLCVIKTNSPRKT